MFFGLDMNVKGFITSREYHQSSLFDNILNLEEYNEDDTKFNFFNYNYFYIICCIFNELDSDEDGYLTLTDLEGYKEHNTPRFVVERIFSQKGFKFLSDKENQMSYIDFIWYIMCEEDKTSDQSIHFWFRILDLDSDGVLS